MDPELFLAPDDPSGARPMAPPAAPPLEQPGAELELQDPIVDELLISPIPPPPPAPRAAAAPPVILTGTRPAAAAPPEAGSVRGAPRPASNDAQAGTSTRVPIAKTAALSAAAAKLAAASAAHQQRSVVPAARPAPPSTAAAPPKPAPAVQAPRVGAPSLASWASARAAATPRPAPAPVASATLRAVAPAPAPPAPAQPADQAPASDMTQQPTTDQNAPAAAEATPPATPPPSEAIIPAQAADEVRADKLIGMTVYDTAGEKVGEVKDILFNENGQATGVVLSVGGVLGLGAKSVGLQWSEVDIKPDAEVGWHVDHQPSSWDLVYRAEMAFAEMAPYSDFIKIIVYHDVLGPRIRYWYLERFQKTILGELSLEQSLDLYYTLFGYDKKAEPKLDQLATKGFSPDYVFRETKRSVASTEGKTRIYSGIGFDVPWGYSHIDADPEQVYESVLKAFEAGAGGIVVSREYEEMRVPNLRAVGRAMAELKRRNG